MHIKGRLNVEHCLEVWSTLTQRDNILMLLAAGNSKIRYLYSCILPLSSQHATQSSWKVFLKPTYFPVSY